MSLHMALKVNSRAIGGFSATRRDWKNGTDPDGVNTYDVDLMVDGKRLSGTLEHRYGDGAWALLRATMDLLLP